VYYAAGIAGGLFFGIAAAVIADLSDGAFRSLTEVERALGATMLGVMPAFAHKRRGLLGGRDPSKVDRKRFGSFLSGVNSTPADIYVVEQPGSVFAESVRSLRTTLSLSRKRTPPQVILVTSSIPGEGKTTLSLNLAAMFGHQGSKVLLVNGDLRSRGLDIHLAIPDNRGLSAALGSSTVDPQCHTLENAPNVSVVVGGATPSFPAELLGSNRMRQLVSKWRSEYDYIIIDSPPVLAVTDAILLAQIADASLLVVRYGSTPRQTAQRSYRTLGQQLPEKTILGVALNAVPEGSVDFNDYYGFQNNTNTFDGAILNGTK
jgi:capsular exopolysaccharide synthesis family protein